MVRWAGADAVRNEAMDMAFRAMDLPREDDPDISDIARAALGGRPRSAGEITENGEPGTS